MNYNFVFDEDFNEKFSLDLSGEELKVVIATVLGGHNALFFGDRPERLLKAVKLLSKGLAQITETSSDISIEKFCGGGPNLSKGAVSLADDGILMMSNIQDYKVSVLEMLNFCITEKHITISRAGRGTVYPANFQLVCSAQSCDEQSKSSRIKNIIDKFDIVYCCKEDTVRTVCQLKDIKPTYSKYMDRYTNWCDLRKNGNIETSAIANLSSVALAQHEESELVSKTKRLSKTLSSMNGHGLVWGSDVTEALTFNNSYNL